MSQCVRNVMSPNPVVVSESASVLDAARAMADANIGPVLVVDRHHSLRGVVTDRDIVVRAVAPGRSLATTAVGEMCTEETATLSLSDSVAEAIRVMRRHAVRRLPVVEDGKPVGVVSIGDLVLRPEVVPASELRSAFIDIMGAPPDDPSTESHPNVTAALSGDWDVPRMPAAADLDRATRRRRAEPFQQP